MNYEDHEKIATLLMGILLQDDNPENHGFKYLGSGCSRKVWRFGDFVYKAERQYDYALATYTWSKSAMCNVDEFNNACKMRAMDLPEIWAIPDTQLVEALGHTMVVMEYVDGFDLDRSGYDYYSECNELSALTQLYDMYSQNVRYSNGKLYPIDMAG
jgi:hypothetical protein